MLRRRPRPGRRSAARPCPARCARAPASTRPSGPAAFGEDQRRGEAAAPRRRGRPRRGRRDRRPPRRWPSMTVSSPRVRLGGDHQCPGGPTSSMAKHMVAAASSARARTSAGRSWREGRLGQPAAVGVVAAQPPVHPQRPASRAGSVRVAGGKAALDGRGQVGVLGVDPGERGDLPAVAGSAARPPRRGATKWSAWARARPGPTRRPPSSRPGRTARPAPAAGSAGGPRRRRRRRATAPERLQDGQHAVGSTVPRPRRHRLEVVEPEAAHEDGEQPQQRLLARAEQAVAPVEGGAQRALPAAGRVAPSSSAVVEPGEQGRRVEQPARARPPARGRAGCRPAGRRSPRRRAVVLRPVPQPGCDGVARGRAAGVRRASCRPCALPSGSRAARRRPRSRRGRAAVRGWWRARSGPARPRSAAATSGAAASRCSKLSRTSRSCWSRSRSGERRAGRRRRAGGRRRRHRAMAGSTASGSSSGASSTKTDAVGEPVPQRGRDGQREPGLADPAGAGQGDQPVRRGRARPIRATSSSRPSSGVGGHRQVAAAGGGGVAGRAAGRAVRGRTAAIRRGAVAPPRRRARPPARGGVRVRAGAGAALEGADRVAAQAGPLGELLLREARRPREGMPEPSRRSP